MCWVNVPLFLQQADTGTDETFCSAQGSPQKHCVPFNPPEESEWLFDFSGTDASFQQLAGNRSIGSA